MVDVYRLKLQEFSYQPEMCCVKDITSNFDVRIGYDFDRPAFKIKKSTVAHVPTAEIYIFGNMKK